MSTEDDELYQCVGVCMVDETSGLCMGCGKPVQEPASATSAQEAWRPAPNAGPQDLV